MMRLYSFRAARTCFDSGADTFLIQVATNTNDHENHLQLLRMIVNCILIMGQELRMTVYRRPRIV